ncbi:hypothetical protein FS749_001783 [Ceratobasidium sp. UAMH 11750]|nr:hypothetical protein FS749_001783 [Ceratobasidium sp. UAMH 11750]
MSDVTMGKPEDEVTAGTTTQTTTDPSSSPAGKGKGKGVAEPVDESMEEDEDDEEEEDDAEGEEEEEEEEEEDMSEIDPQAIIQSNGGRSRRNRPTVDYSSKEAMAKAGIDPSQVNDDD